MEKIYPNASEKLVNAVKLYADGSNNLYFDAAGANKVSSADVANLFEKGLVLVAKGEVEYRATSWDGTTLVSGEVEFTCAE